MSRPSRTKKVSKPCFTLRFRLNPTDAQVPILSKNFGYRRKVYNEALGIINNFYSMGLPYPGKYTLNGIITELRRLYPYLKNGSSNSYQNAIQDLDESFQKLFNKQGGRPKFRSKKKHKDTITFTQGIKLEGTMLSVEKISDIPIVLDKQSRNPKKPFPTTKPIRVTITRVPSGKYFVSLTYRADAPPVPYIPVGVIGQDQGIKSLVVDSNDKEIKPRNPLRKAQKVLRRKQRSLARKVYKSKNYLKQKRQVALTHEKITNIRCFHLDLTAHNSVQSCKRNNHALAIQSLNIQNQLKNRKLAKAIADAGMGYYHLRLKVECKEHGATLLNLDNWAATSKLCSNCWHKNDALTLADRYWVCPNCFKLHNRDKNAALVCKAIGEVYLGLRNITRQSRAGSAQLKACMVDEVIKISFTDDEAPTSTLPLTTQVVGSPKGICEESGIESQPNSVRQEHSALSMLGCRKTVQDRTEGSRKPIRHKIGTANRKISQKVDRNEPHDSN